MVLASHFTQTCSCMTKNLRKRDSIQRANLLKFAPIFWSSQGPCKLAANLQGEFAAVNFNGLIRTTLSAAWIRIPYILLIRWYQTQPPATWTHGRGRARGSGRPAEFTKRLLLDGERKSDLTEASHIRKNTYKLFLFKITAFHCNAT